MRRSLTSAVALVGAGMGVAAQPARTEPDAKAAEISTWRWNVDNYFFSVRGICPNSQRSSGGRSQPAGANRRNDF